MAINRLVSISEDGSLPPAAKVTDQNLPPRLTDTELGNKFMVRGSLILSVKDYGAKGDGVTDDSAAVQTAITAAEGRSLFFPAGKYIIGSATRLRIHQNFTSLIGDAAGGGSILLFTHASGGLDIGDGAAFIYENRLVDIILQGNGVVTTLVRMRMAYEPWFRGARLEGGADTLLLLHECGQLDADRMTLSTAPIGMRVTGTIPSIITVRLPNFYDLRDGVRWSAASIGRLLIDGGWMETVDNIVSLNNPGQYMSVHELKINKVRVLHTGTTFRMFRVAALSGWNAVVMAFDDCYIDAPNSTTPMYDFTALNNTMGDVNFRIDRGYVSSANSGHLVQAHASQNPVSLRVDVRDVTVNGSTYGTNRWVKLPMQTGGAWTRPYEISGWGAPEGIATAPPGSTYRDAGGASGATFFVKESGYGTTGWIAK